jgi:hypothetical protein
MGRYLDLITASSTCEKSEIIQEEVFNSLNSHVQSDQWADFRVALRALDARCPNRVEDHSRWRQAVADAEAFLAQWGEQALVLGWTVDNLFGLHPLAPLLRYDAMGLVWLLQGRSVVALTSESAAIENPSGAICVYRRYSKPAPGCSNNMGAGKAGFP